MKTIGFMAGLVTLMLGQSSVDVARAAVYDGPGGPILVVASAANPFGNYYAEILRAEGLNEFAVSDISLVTPSVLSAYDVVILGDQPLSSAQVTTFSNWVNSGGNLIAMRPDKQLAGLLGLADASATLSNAYLRVYGTGAGAGIVTETIQFHGVADCYSLNGATALASLYSDATTDTLQPAVTVCSVGSSGGHAAAFTFDLARSVVYTRQGNPAWSGQERDGLTPIRPDDLYYGAASLDPEPDWVDLNKVAIPQADEQQRLLANLIGQMNLGRRPLPRFWYFPNGYKAVVVMTGDDHANGGTAGRFDHYAALSPANSSVSDWTAIRSTSYLYPWAGFTDTQAAAYNAAGFEMSLHLNTGCANYTRASLTSFFIAQMNLFKATYPSLPSPTTHRIHCIAWSDYTTAAEVGLLFGIRLDVSYYYWPGSWVLDRPGMFTGSGMPMRFAELDGTMLDVYQAPSQMTDESGQTFPHNSDALLNGALGSQGYYGAFVANMHTDLVASPGSDAILSSAMSRGVPVISALQLLTWTDARNNSSFSGITWGGGVLAFTVSAASGARNLQAMVPTTAPAWALTGISLGSNSVAYTNQTIKGVEYAFFPATNGSYLASYTPEFIDTTFVDFSAGTADTNTYIAQTIDSGVSLAPMLVEEFLNGVLPAGWSSTNWNPGYWVAGSGGGAGEGGSSGSNWIAGGSVAVTSGNLQVAGAAAATTTSYGPGRSLEFVATFNAAAFQHVGFAAGLAFDAPWAIFSTFNTTNSLYARTALAGGSSPTDTLIPGNWLGSPHRYRIDWTTTNVVFSIDGTALATNTAAISTSLSPIASDDTPGGPGLSVDWVRMTPYAGAGTFISRVLDAGVAVNWGTLSWTSQTPAGTSLALSYRTGNTPIPDGSWTAFIPVSTSGASLAGNSRYLQYQAQLSTSDPAQTPTLNDVTATYNFGVGATPPTLLLSSPASGATGVPVSASINLRFSEMMNSATITSGSFRLRRVGELIDVPAAVTSSGILATLTPDTSLVAGASYQVTVAGTVADLIGDALGSDVVWTFSTAPNTASQTDTTVADFSAGTPDSNTCIAQTADGELILMPALGAEFYGSTLPAGWTSTPWGTGGSATVAGGSLATDGASVAATTSYGPGRSLEFVATFNAAAFQHAGLAADSAFDFPWAIFSTVSSTNTLYARTSDGWSTPLSGNCLGSPHRFRIDWMTTNVTFSIDGTPLAANAIALSDNMSPVASDFTVGGPSLLVDWMRLTPYALSSTFASRIIDAGGPVSWGSLAWTTSTPPGTTLGLSYRTGNTPVPDGSWSGFTAVSASPSALGGNSRYFQYLASLATSDASQTPVLQDVTVAWNLTTPAVTPAIAWNDPADIIYGTTLSGTQLNATASVPGTFTYSPPAGTVLYPGTNQTLSVSFVPTDTVNYTNASAAVQINVWAPPAITSSPQSRTNVVGTTAGFSVTASGTQPLSYQWQANGADIGDATSNSLTLNNVQASQAGSYAVVVTNVAGSVTSTVALLTVWVPPAIVTQPQSTTNVAGTAANLSVTASGSAPLSYQWFFNGTNLLAGATADTLTLSNVQPADAGSYAVVVTNVVGSATSGVASLTVLVAPAIVSGPTDQTVIPGAGASFSVLASGSAPLSYQWFFNETNPLAGATVDTLVLAQVQPADAGNYSVVVTNLAGSATSGVASLTLLVAPTIVSDPTNQAVVVGADASFNVTASGSAPLSYQWFFNGTNLLAGATADTLTLSNVQPADAGSYAVVVTNVAGSATSGVASLTVLVAPAIVSGPTDQTVIPGAGASFSVLASGSAPLSYQWFFNETNPLAGATVDTLVLAQVQPADAGNYSVVVTNLAGSATSGVASLTLLVAPTIVSDPTNQAVVVGADASFNVTASGSAPLSYQWFFNGTNLLAGATADTLTLSNVQPADAGSYAVVVTNVVGSATSGVASLTVLVAPAIVSGPTDQTVIPGAGASFSVLASGSAPLSYQWFFNGTNLLAGATADTLTLSNVQPADAGNYSVVVTNLAGSATSSVASLVVLVTPTISGISLTTAEVSISFASLPGLRYSLEYKGSLEDTVWVPLLPPAVGTGGALVLHDTNVVAAHRFYRVRCE